MRKPVSAADRQAGRGDNIVGNPPALIDTTAGGFSLRQRKSERPGQLAEPFARWKDRG